MVKILQGDKEFMMKSTAKNHYLDHSSPIDDLCIILEEEIALYNQRIKLLNRATLVGQEELKDTFKEMVRVRKAILCRLQLIR
jgi:hypothetical protein